MKFYQPVAKALILALSALTLTQAVAHHSFAAYDQTVTKAVTGTLKEFDWNAPHSSMTVAFIDASGKADEVSVTTGAPATISGQGFKSRDFKAGQKVIMTWHPNRNGVPGGELVNVTLEDGRVLTGGFGRPPGPPPATK
ncbi:MAG: DUF6152 family protein [Sphingomonadaceae bacterium]